MPEQFLRRTEIPIPSVVDRSQRVTQAVDRVVRRESRKLGTPLECFLQGQIAYAEERVARFQASHGKGAPRVREELLSIYQRRP